MNHLDESELEARGHREDVPLTVSQLNWVVKNLLETAMPKVWVEGEVSDLSRPSSGHLYFTLKDQDSQVRSVIWRSTAARQPFRIEDGMSLVCCGSVEVYPTRGSYQLIINRIQPQGVGALQLAFQQLHQKLKAQGFFDADRKQELPSFPEHIAFVTSPSGAALSDFVEAAKARWGRFRLTVVPARVQGDEAAGELIAGIRAAQKMVPRPDLLIVGRGGGSIEDLWCFNDEKLVRAIVQSKIPVVSAVGHEIDVTLSDLAADARALTPTQAATIVFPDREQLVAKLQQFRRSLGVTMHRRVEQARLRLTHLGQRGLLNRPHELHLRRRQSVDDLDLRARNSMWRRLESCRERLAGLARASEALSPLAVLSRGYSITTVAGEKSPLERIEDVASGDRLVTRIADGQIESVVDSKATT